MSSISFRTARRVLRPVRKYGTGVLMLGLALSASARDASLPGTAAGTQAEAKTPPAAASKPVRSRKWPQIGVASWYGSQFQGRKTAAGERFDMNSMTCAHPTLPMGTWLRVTNLKNRKTAFVRVNDRGPVLEGRIVDLSFAAARALGLAGVGKVRLDAVRDGDAELDRALVAQVQMPALAGSMVR